MATTAVVLLDPKTPYNVGSVIRACSLYGISTLRWTGTRVHANKARMKAGTHLKSHRFPREERMKEYSQVDWAMADDKVITDLALSHGLTPVAVEKRESAEPLDTFLHPHRALYVFGPEDGSIPKAALTVCHRFVVIPTVSKHVPLNLAAAVNVVLYDRLVKARAAEGTNGQGKAVLHSVMCPCR